MTQNVNVTSRFARARRTPMDIAHDPMLSNARKIELLKSIKEHSVGSRDETIIRDADLALEEMLRSGLRKH